MKNIIDLVHLDTGVDRDTVEKVITHTLTLTKQSLLEGSKVYWPGLCTFEWKNTARAKKPKVVEEESIPGKTLSASGFKDISLAKAKVKEGK